MVLKLRLLGEPQFEYAGELLNIERRKAFALLAYLALSKHRQSREILAALLWPELNQERAAAALRTVIYSLTTVAPGDWLDKERTTLAFSPDHIWIDVLIFLDLIARARTHRHENNIRCEECAGLLNIAVDLYRGDFMLGFSIAESSEYNDWLLIQQEWLKREFTYALRRLANFYGETGDFETAIVYANRWLALDPLNEAAHRLLMHLYAASGQRTMALRQYQRCVELLDTELATPPEEETNQLYAAIQAENTLSFNNAPGTGQKKSILPRLPSLVIGRERTLHEIKSRMGLNEEVRSTTVIHGWPGVGKSTIVAALAHDPDIAFHFPDGVLWVSLGKAPNLLGELTIWAEALGLHDSSRDRKIETLSVQLAAVLRERRMLLMIDDVWQIDHATSFKVGGRGCATIFTSRFNDIAQALAPTAYNNYRLSVLTEEAALELLGRLTPETVTEYPDAAYELVRNLEGLPLAIQVAGRLLHAETRLGWGVSDLLQELRSGAALLAAQPPDDLVEGSPTIAALLKRSTDTLDLQIKQQFALLGLFASKPATFDLGALAAAWDVNDPKAAVRVLVNRGLLEPISGGRFQMHALLVHHARSILEESPRL